jgi:lysophospholipase L1-like esterase
MVPLIICFGDSLTAGYQSPTPAHPVLDETPYGSFLQERLGPKARVRVSGVCGEITGEMVMRFREDVLAHRPAFVIILGGTNDLGMNAQPAEVMRNLLKMYESASAARIQPVAMTIPSIRVGEGAAEANDQPWIRSHLDRRQVLNRLITEYCERRQVPLVDLFAATAEPGTGFLAAPFSNDGLHLTTHGYRLMAQLLYDQVFKPRFLNETGN